MSRFDYVKYDEEAQKIQSHFKDFFEALETMAETFIRSPRAKALVHTNLEVAYMWIGKGIRDDQIERNGAAELLESRGE